MTDVKTDVKTHFKVYKKFFSRLYKRKTKHNQYLYKEYWIKPELTGEDKYHKTDGPAIIIYHENGLVDSMEWCIDGELHRTDGPAIIEYSNNGDVTSQSWYRHGVLHREDGPAVIKWKTWMESSNDVDKPLSVSFYLNGVLHRADGPATMEYYYSSADADKVIYYLRKESWYVDGKLHRTDGPATIEYDMDEDIEDGTIIKIAERWHVDNELHREDGPAVVAYSGDGEESRREYFINGNRRISAEPDIVMRDHNREINAFWSLNENYFSDSLSETEIKNILDRYNKYSLEKSITEVLSGKKE